VNILIGGTGFIGSALAQALVKRDEEVVSVSRSGRGDVAGVKYVTADFNTDLLPQSLVRKANNIFFLIGQIGPNFDAGKEKKVLQRVVKPLARGKQKIFLFSTALVYGNSKTPVDEHAPSQPIGVYPQFKLASEKIIHDIIPADRLVILRLANVYGSPKNRGLIGVAMKKIVNSDRTPLQIHGGGQQRRDYIFLDDVVGAILAVKEKASNFGTVNVATGHTYSILEVIELLSGVVGQTIPYEFADYQPEEAQTLIISNRHLQDHFGYRRFTPLREGLKKTIARYRKGNTS